MLNNLNGMIGVAAEIHTSPEAMNFLSCVKAPESKTDSALWLKRIRLNVRRIIYHRAQAVGDPMDNSATPLSLEHIRLMNRAYATEGSKDAMERKFSITSAWASVGRSSELSWVPFDSIQWDEEYGCCFAVDPQAKVAKMKLVAFTAGSDWDCCFFTCLGDLLSAAPLPIDYFEERFTDGSTARFMFPFLRGSESPGQKLGRCIKAVAEGSRGAQSKFAAVALPPSKLPATCNAAGLRPGACNRLCTYITAEHAVRNTGHDLRQQSALYDYVDPDRSLLMPGARVLAGFPPPPWGQTGPGPKAASIETIFDSVGEAAVEEFIDALFFLDSRSPPEFMVGAMLRPMIHAAAAHVIMYYPVRCNAKKEFEGMQPMHLWMRQC